MSAPGSCTVILPNGCSLLQQGEARVIKLLEEKKEELHLVRKRFFGVLFGSQSVIEQLAHALVEHETLTAEEVRKVIKGEPIRKVEEKVSPAVVHEDAREPLPAPS